MYMFVFYFGPCSSQRELECLYHPLNPSVLSKKSVKVYPKQEPQETNMQGIFPKEEGFTLCHISIALSTRLSG